MKTPILILTALLALGLSAQVLADPAASEQKAKTLCAGCHGPNGVSLNPLWPNLAGQQAQYLAKALHDFKSGQRTDPSMTPMAQPLTDQEIEELAAYFAALPAGG